MKIFLPLQRTLTVFLMIVTLVLVNGTAVFAATKTWAGSTGGALNWNTGLWSPVGAPVAGDDIIFNTAGVLTFTTMPASIGFNSLTISQGTVTFTNGSAWVLTIGSGAPVDLSIASGASLTLGNNTTITLLNNATTANITGTLALSGTGAFTTAANSTVTYNGAAQNVIAASFSNLTLAGTNTKTLLGNTTVSGILTINAGVTLAMGANTIGAPSSLVMTSGASASAITGTGLITLGGNVTVNFTGPGATPATIATPVALGANRQFNVAGSAGLTMNGVISNPGVSPPDPPFGGFALNKTGTGTITFNAANTFFGDFVLSDGTAVVSNVTGLGPALNANSSNRVSILNGGTIDLATNSTVDPYTFYIGSDATILSNRATVGAGVNHMLAGLTYSASTLTVNRGLNATSGSPAVTFQNVRLFGGGTLNTGTADVFISGVVSGFDAPWKFTKTGAGTLTKTTEGWDLPGDFEINAGTYTPNGFNTTIAGNWINNGGTFTTGTSTFTLRNTVPTAQTIGGTQPTTFNNLVIDNTAGVSLAANQTVNGALTMTNGNLTIPINRTLIIGSGTVIGGSPFSAAKSIVTQSDPGSTAKGFVRINNMANAAYLIPVSDGTNYLPVTLTPTGGAANNSYSACVFQGITTNGERNGTPFTAGQKNTCVDAVWTVNYNGVPAPNTTMRVEWPTSLEGAKFTTFTLPAQIGISRYNAGWGIPNGTGAHGTPNQATRTAITAFSPFGVGNPAYQVLATRITYFNAAKGNGYNTVNWQAACSSSQATFEVLRSTDGRNFTSINSLTASQARCAQPFNYQDNTAPQGVVYYRLKVIDVDGQETLSTIVKISSDIKSMEVTGIAPNPVSNVAQLKINASKVDVVNLTIISSEGQVVYRNNVPLQPGSSVVNLDIAKLPAGLYMIKGVFTDGQTNSIRFIKQ